VTPDSGKGGSVVRVGVTLFGGQAALLPPASEGGRTVVAVEQPASVGQVLDRLNVPPEGRTYVTVNGRHVVGLGVLVGEGDEISVIVPLGGG